MMPLNLTSIIMRDFHDYRPVVYFCTYIIFFVHIVLPGMGSPPTYPNGEGVIRICQFQSRRPCNKGNRII